MNKNKQKSKEYKGYEPDNKHQGLVLMSLTKWNTGSHTVIPLAVSTVDQYNHLKGFVGRGGQRCSFNFNPKDQTLTFGFGNGDDKVAPSLKVSKDSRSVHLPWWTKIPVGSRFLLLADIKHNSIIALPIGCLAGW